MISDRELWQCAGEVLKQHGDNSVHFVAERLAASAPDGDAEGVTVRKAIARPIDELQQTDPVVPIS